MTVRIEHSGYRTTVTAGGVDISNIVRSIRIDIDAGNLPEATIELLPKSMCLDLPDDVVRIIHEYEPDAEVFGGA